MTNGGWPEDWDERKAGRDCPMCASLGLGDNDHTVTIAELAHTEVRLERRSRLPGYVIVVWRHGHVSEPTELEADQAAGYWRDVTAVARVIERIYRPAKTNLLTMGNWVPHLHTHVVPRPFAGDPAPGGPLPWAELLTESPNDPEGLRREAEAIRRMLLDGG